MHVCIYVCVCVYERQREREREKEREKKESERDKRTFDAGVDTNILPGLLIDLFIIPKDTSALIFSLFAFK